MTVQILRGFKETHRSDAVTLFWSAFERKLAILFGPTVRAQAFFSRVADPNYAVSAIDRSGRLVGVAGFKTKDGAFTGGSFSDLKLVYGTFGAFWRAALSIPLDRSIEPGVLLMDRIFVHPDARRQGIGTKLLNEIKTVAAEYGCTKVRLDVIDSNPRAKALYEREGFIAQGEVHTWPLQWLFKFKSATKMIWTAES